MTFPLQRSRPSRAAALCAAGMLGFPAIAPAQTAVAPADAFEALFQLGLPDSRGAKWVTARGPSIPHESGIPGLGNDDGTGTGGNAWLVREERDGTVELIVAQSRRVRVPRIGDGSAKGRRDAALQGVDIAPADLDKDTKKLAAALGGEKPAARNPRIPGLDGEDEDEAHPGIGEALLFLAHLHRQGGAETARKLLPELLARASAPEGALDAAISLLADSRLAQATADWSSRGDAAAYAKAIDAIGNDFSRGWKNRDAALLLAQRVRAPEIPHTAQDPTAKKAAAFFLALKTAQFAELPIGQNWLLPGSVSRSRSLQGMRMMLAVEGLEDLADPDPSESAPAPVPARASPVAAFFADRRAALAPLAKLLGDQRMLRVLRSNGQFGGMHRSYHFGENSPEQLLKQSYDAIPRPYELGEIVLALLAPLLPEEVSGRSVGGTPQTDEVLAWAAKIAKLSDEELAWDYLRRASNSYDGSFATALGWLVSHGSAEALEKLQEVFSDPAVWAGGGEHRVLPLLTIYLKRFGGDTAALGDKIKAAFKTALEDQQLTRGSFAEINQPDEMKQETARQVNAQLKQLDQILKPRALAEILKDAANAEGDEARTLSQTIAAAVANTPWKEAEAQLFAAAATAKSLEARQELLQLITLRGGSAMHLAAKKATAAPVTAVTREAIETLLQDDRSTTRWNGGNDQSIADAAATALIWSRLSAAEVPRVTGMIESNPEIASPWLKARARALVRGEPAPRFPDAANVAGVRVEAIITELASLTPEASLARNRALAADEQLAVSVHLQRLEKWPPALVTAHFTIAKVTDTKFAEAGLAAMQSRQFDEGLRRELDAMIEKAAQEDRRISVSLAATGMLRGLTLLCEVSEQTTSVSDLEESEIPALEGKPPPDAVLGCYLQGNSQTGDDACGYLVPVWKDPVSTSAWRLAAAKAAESNVTAGESVGEESEGTADSMNNRPAFEKRLRALRAFSREDRAPFTVTWVVMPITKESEP